MLRRCQRHYAIRWRAFDTLIRYFLLADMLLLPLPLLLYLQSLLI